MPSFQQYVQGTTVNKVVRPTSPPGYYIEFQRDKNGIVTHFIEHTALRALEPSAYSRFHPLMMTQTNDWIEYKAPEEKPVVKVSGKKSNK